MPGFPESTPPTVPPPIDLTQVNEATRRALYDAVVAIHFAPWAPEEIAEAVRKDEWYLDHTAEDARVSLVYFAGRWIAWWRDLSADEDAPESAQFEVLTIYASPGEPYGIGFQEV
ncbi:MAG TPA: hypothetical protein VOA87_23130 [Thermoanaerobaculia bacterium]|nr:hypothetical protein [Thermoanaerobaculia bacterium]